MRWRVFVNTLEKTGGHDRMQRVSLAIEKLAPIAMAVLMIPSAIALAGLSGYVGYQLGSGASSIALQFVRLLLVFGTALAIIGPIMMPGTDRTNPVRLLLLPIPERTLYVAQASGAVGDPWILLAIPMMLGLPLGLLLGGAIVAAGAAVLAGVLLLATLVGLTALTTTVLYLVMRDRRRGELVALIVILILPMIGVLPALLGNRYERRERARRAAEERAAPPEQRAPAWLTTTGLALFALTPSELYTTTVERAPQDRQAAAAPLGGLALLVAALHTAGFALFRRVLASPSSVGARRVGSSTWLSKPLPWVSAGTSAVALALVRIATRTTRGRSILLVPLVMLVILGFMALGTGSFTFGPFRTGGSLGMATLLAAISLLAVLPIAMNQFAVDGAGLTLTLLAPITARQILVGKAIGVALIAIPSALVGIALVAALFPSGHPALWLTLPLSLVATYTLAAPVAAILSAVFPRVADLNSIGSRSNAHGVAGFVGMLALAGSALPCAVLALVAARLLGQPWLAPLFVAIWCVVAAALASVMFRVAERVFENRRENLAMLI
jgi:hypothetical protein